MMPIESGEGQPTQISSPWSVCGVGGQLNRPSMYCCESTEEVQRER